MASHALDLTLQDADQTARLAVTLGRVLTAGDVVLLTGDVGAGKTHFARALIQSLLDVPEDVPSPTFTLVQTYDTRDAAIWHADLYRLTSVYEIEELGLTDAFSDAICLVEWPDRLGDVRPEDALDLTLTVTGDDTRRLSATWNDDKWHEKLGAWRK
ncbi:MAG: tRNA (adenosine(37)-N6)-threonylcarbamoyltransferase complex ATPase subunit type 1 TsaE [Sulfitobacter sp.]|jgi:tRNA threonylcarbamoyladenosine biosynthesis protein TsaE|uniref:tRNA (adenosine(37)-N6)-threonylcarbamoyltransferase complex ATPase subunit type 1 TsaE n=1 Tax=unclassified Sulfitobacter TaxID=196795 RepID=UPI0011104D65|nr:tRNA (adenosine(37)-N6)-threonylcarbamoyltransferase complex ATPase subunit type 1 TsaE [Sulfitobacter sp. BSw21498]